MRTVALNPHTLMKALLLLVLGVAASVPLTSCQMKELTELRDGDAVSAPHGLFPNPAKCAECHVEIYDEWKNSPHAMAFVNETFRQATDDYRFKECIGCHAPQPWLTSGRPEARSTQHDLGVVCVSCHLEDGAMVGPKPPTGLVRPHPIVVKPAVFESGLMCGRCHDGTLKQWQASDASIRKNCAECHMPEVHRTMTQATGLISKPIVAMEKAGPEHRHTFDIVTPGTSETSIEINASATPDRLDISLLNRLPHALPTGDFGVRVVRVTAIATDSRGITSMAGVWEVSGSVDRSIPSGGRREWTVQLAPDAQRITIEVVRLGRRPEDETLLLRKEVVVH